MYFGQVGRYCTVSTVVGGYGLGPVAYVHYRLSPSYSRTQGRHVRGSGYLVAKPSTEQTRYHLFVNSRPLENQLPNSGTSSRPLELIILSNCSTVFFSAELTDAWDVGLQ